MRIGGAVVSGALLIAVGLVLLTNGTSVWGHAAPASLNHVCVLRAKTGTFFLISNFLTNNHEGELVAKHENELFRPMADRGSQSGKRQGRK